MRDWNNDKKRAGELVDLLQDEGTDSATKEEIRAWFWSGVSSDAKESAMIGRFRRIMPNPAPDAYDRKKYAELAARLNIGGARKRYTLKRRMAPILRATAGIAAGVMLALVISGVAYLWMNRGPLDGMQHVATVTANEGKPTPVELPDGSSAEVTSGSMRHNTNFDQERFVELAGEALFNVAKDSTKTFTVKTDHLTIFVLGTEFKVCSDAGNDYSTVDLYRGSIRVEAADRSLVMVPGQHLNYSHSTGTFRISGISAAGNMPDSASESIGDEYGSNALLFENRPMGEILAVIEQFYGADMDISGQLPDSYRYTIGFSPDMNVERVLKLLSEVEKNLRYTIEQDRIRITLK